MSEINKLSLKAFYEKNKDNYYKCRKQGGDQWDESYKWNAFTKTNQELSGYAVVSKDNIANIVQILQKNQKNFTDWRSVDNFNLLVEKPNGWQVIRAVWGIDPSDVVNAIVSANEMSELLGVGKFSASVYAYILAAQNADQFAIHRDFIAKSLADVMSEKTPITPGDKYQLLNDAALYVGELMQQDDIVDGLDYRALNGQDFFWVAFAYEEGTDDSPEHTPDDITHLTPEAYRGTLASKGFVFLKSQTAFPAKLGVEYVYSHPNYTNQFYITRLDENEPYAFNAQLVTGEKFDRLYPHNAEGYGKGHPMWAGEAFYKLMDKL